MKRKIFIIGLVIAAFAGYGQTTQSEKIQLFDSLLKSNFDEVKEIVPSISLAVVKGNEIIYSKALGYADVENQILATPTTGYYIASLTKSFTGTLASKLHNEKRIDLNSPITAYLKSGRFEDASIESAGITVQDLLTHTSGLTNDPLTTRAAFTGYSNRDVMTNCLYRYTTFGGTKGEYNYDNLGYNMYSKIIEEELGSTWKQLLMKEIIEPIGLKNTSVYLKTGEESNSSVAHAYVPNEAGGVTKVALQKKDNTMQSAGGMFSSAEDLGKWIEFTMNGGQGVVDGDVVKRATSTLSSVDTATRTLEPFIINGYGLGWKTGIYVKEKVIFHSGSFAGSLSHLSYMPDHELGIAILVNEMMVGGQLTNTIISTFYDIFTSEPDASKLNVAQTNLAQMAEKTPGRVFGYKKGILDREWKLSLDQGEYISKYYNDAYGELEIKVENNNMVVEFGNTYAVLTAFKNEDSARVEFVPFFGEVIQFNMANGKVESLTYNNAVFMKI